MKEVSTGKWNVLHMYALDTDFENARSGFINYGQEKGQEQLAARSEARVALYESPVDKPF